MAKQKLVICPYCGETQSPADACRACRGLFDPLSRQATHNEMGPWFIREPERPFQPGCSYETLIRLVERGTITKYSLLRGPTTRQFWTVAKHVPGVSHLVGYCHSCDAEVDPDAYGCPECGVPFGAYLERNYLGLPDVRPLPGDAPDDSDQPGGYTETWTPPVAQPRGLSSFASDEEILDPAAMAPGASATLASRSAGASMSSWAGADPAPDEVPSAAVPSEPWHASPAARALQRRVEAQQRLIRVLAVVLATVTILTVGIVIFGGLGSPRPTPDASPDTPPAAGEATSDDAAALPSGAVETQGPVSDDPVSVIDEPDVSSEVSPDAGDEPSMPVPPDVADPDASSSTLSTELQSAHDLALAKIAEARDETRGQGERITLYEEALELLRRIEREAPTDRRPADLDERITSVEDAIEQLDLERYFP